MKETVIETIGKRFANLLSVKSLVTIALTIAFVILTCRGVLDQNFMMIYTVIVSFYFGTQSQKQAAQTNAESTPEVNNYISLPEGADSAEIAQILAASGVKVELPEKTDE